MAAIRIHIESPDVNEVMCRRVPWGYTKQVDYTTWKIGYLATDGGSQEKFCKNCQRMAVERLPKEL